MIIHFIQHKGKGLMVLGVPLTIAFILFLVADIFSLSDEYIAAVSLVISAAILYLIDTKQKVIIDGGVIQRKVKLPRQKRQNTLMWIEVRYWAIIFAVLGLAKLIYITQSLF